MAALSKVNDGNVHSFVHASNAARQLCDRGWRWGSLSIEQKRILTLRVAGERVRLHFDLFLATDRFLGIVVIHPSGATFKDPETVYRTVGGALKLLGYKALRGLNRPDSLHFRKRLNDVRKLDREWKSLASLEGRLAVLSGSEAIPTEDPIVRRKQSGLEPLAFLKVAAWLRRKARLGWKARAAGWALKRVSHRHGCLWTIFFGVHWVGKTDKLDLSITIWPQRTFGRADKKRLTKVGFYAGVLRYWKRKGFDGRWQPWCETEHQLWALFDKTGLATRMAISEALQLIKQSPIP